METARQAAERLTGLLDRGDKLATRAHLEGARNALVAAADKIDSLQRERYSIELDQIEAAGAYLFCHAQFKGDDYIAKTVARRMLELALEKRH